ncbi:MAG: 3-dehydroquinate synthase [Ignavibacteriales bacterium]|nr:3-dehydroquinate synthase [Ignavibacteriales bacterium]
MIKRQIDVSLGDRSYPIYFGSGLTASFAPTCQQHGIPRRVIIVTDTNVAHHYLSALENNLKHFDFVVSSIVIPPGENQKSLQRSNALFTALLKQGVGRASAIVALGGGVIGDLAGFVAATYQRGVLLVQVPTTLLSQVDSSVGGKVAVNHSLGKNMIGAFYQPRFVWVDAETLRTLPPREIVCGLGEVVKYGIVFDADFFAYLESSLDQVVSLEPESVLHVQARCCELKAHVVSEDEREQGLRLVLNFGHTVGHALEAAGHYRALKHGEAVLLGMIAESFIAREMGLLAPDVHQRIVEMILRLPVKFNKTAVSPARVVKAMALDKKSVDGKPRFVLPIRLGEVQVVDEVDAALVQSSLRYVLGLPEKAGHRS